MAYSTCNVTEALLDDVCRQVAWERDEFISQACHGSGYLMDDPAVRELAESLRKERSEFVINRK